LLVEMRILFATNHIHFPQGGGGGERNTHELCLALRDQGAFPAVVSNLRGDWSLLSVWNRVRRKMPPFLEYPCDTVSGYPVFRGWKFREVGSAIKRFRPDVIVVQSTHPEPLLNILRQFSIPLVVYFHEVEEIEHLRTLANTGTMILANSTFTAQRLSDRCGLRCRVVLPLIEPRYYRAEVSGERVLFVNTVPRKGLEIAFGLAQRRRDIPFDFILSWILTSEQIEALQERAKAVGNVILHPPTRDMRPFYAKSKVLLVPSQWEETWGRVATEAHINSIPVLGSDRGGLPQAIGPGGIIVPRDAPMDEWAAGLSRLWDDAVCYTELARAARIYAARPEIQPAEIISCLLTNLREVVDRRSHL
jgi:glycosyltransferase involved in cell wall biosynthesis